MTTSPLDRPASAATPAATADRVAARAGRPVVVKLGGNALASLPDALAVAAASATPRPLVIVHGGGTQISDLMRRRGIEPRFVGGRRITDLPILACVRMALAGVSDELADRLVELGATPAPLRRGEVVRGRRLDELGLVGRVAAVDAAPIERAWAAGRVPLLAPLALDEGGRFLNVNADDVAGAVAAALGAEELVFLSDVEGVLDARGELIPEIRAAAPPPVSGGMGPKVAACVQAVGAGVPRVRIGTGTTVTA
jgi:acetylglutamate kinase